MTEIMIKENTTHQENEISFADGQVFIFSGTSYEGYCHRFNQENTHDLYITMKEYYETKT